MQNYNNKQKIGNLFKYYEKNRYLYRSFVSKALYWQKGLSNQDIPTVKVGILKKLGIHIVMNFINFCSSTLLV